MTQSSDNSQPLESRSRTAVYQIIGNWSTVFKALIAILARIEFEPEIETTNEEMRFIKDAVCFLYTSTSVDFAASGKKLLINNLFKNNYKSDDEEIFERVSTIECIPVFFVEQFQIRRIFPSARDYFGNLKNNLRLIKQVYKIRLNEKRRTRPKRFIGVGYRDKGHLKNISHDGTPGWQELVSINTGRLPRDRRLYEYNVVADLLDNGEIPNQEGLEFQEFLELLEEEELTFYMAMSSE